jgi:Rod binding domain-containing protein
VDVASLSTALGTAGIHTPDSPQKIHDAASQFEALLIGEVMKSAQSSDSKGWLGSDDEEDNSGASAMEFATDYFARAMASKGGLGLSHMIESAMSSKAANSSSPETQPALPLDNPPSDR